MNLDKFTYSVFWFVAGFVVGCFIAAATYSTNSTPVKDDNVIDSLTKINDSIKIKVEHLNSIKNAKVVEVSTLDNDSTLKLFYKLVSE